MRKLTDDPRYRAWCAKAEAEAEAFYAEYDSFEGGSE